MTSRSTDRRKPTRRLRTLAAAGVLVAGTLTAGFLGTTSASADVGAYTIAQTTLEAWAPYQASTNNTRGAGLDVSISCYLIGDYVTGPLSTENIWDLMSGGDTLEPGDFVPDADIYTGSNSPVVPPCTGMHAGTTIGNAPVIVHNGPGASYPSAGQDVPLGKQVEFTCYTTGSWVNGPYGEENIWDRLTLDLDGAAGEWVPDAVVYTGSNSAVAPHC